MISPLVTYANPSSDHSDYDAIFSRRFRPVTADKPSNTVGQEKLACQSVVFTHHRDGELVEYKCGKATSYQKPYCLQHLDKMPSFKHILDSIAGLTKKRVKSVKKRN